MITPPSSRIDEHSGQWDHVSPPTASPKVAQSLRRGTGGEEWFDSAPPNTMAQRR
jgi:hypothetical protein